MMLNRRDPRVLFACLAAAGLVTTAVPALGDPPPSDLAKAIRLDGFAAEQTTGQHVRFAGDINGDGLDDMLVSAPNASAPTESSGAVYVVFGSKQPGTVPLNDLGTKGFRILYAVQSSRMGTSLAAAGDVDNDGYDDILVGSPAPGDRSGLAFLVFGGPTSTDVDLLNLNGRGIAIYGCQDDDRCAASLAGAGDVNADGYADFIVGAPNIDLGTAFIVLGGPTRAHIDLPVTGIRISGAIANTFLGKSVAGAGDVNADGYDDMIIGAPGTGLGKVFGSAVVVYGSPNPSPLSLTALSGKGFWIDASDRDDLTGLAVAGAGDVNADGYDDVVVGVPGAVTGKGAAFVVFGRPTGADVNLGAPGADGYRINGPESLGWAVAGAGDLNDDGRDDVLVGAPYTATGEVFAVYGKPDTATVDTSALAESGFRIEGLAAHDNAGESVAGNGDINGDHAIDLLVGAAFADPGGLDAAGSAFLLLGIPALQPPPVTPTPPTSPTPAATLTVKARPARKAVPRTGKVKLVRSIRVGTGQTARLSVKVVPKKARKHVRIAKTATSVTARTVRSPKARITVRIRASGTGVTAATWKRTWKVR